MPKFGIVYIIIGSNRYLKESVNSARFVLEYNLDVDITFLTDLGGVYR